MVSTSTVWTIIVASLFLLRLDDRIVKMVDAFPNGAGACPPGMAAVMGPHLTTGPNLITGSLSQGDLTLVIGGIPVPPNAVLNFVQGESYEIGVRRDGDQSFRGILFRLQDNSGMGAIDAEPLNTFLKEADACFTEPNTVGLTHTSSVDKNVATGRMVYRPNVVADEDIMGITLDVTVVIQLGDGRSEYYYSPYALNFLALLPTPAPTGNPASPPTLFPPIQTSFPSGVPSLGPGTPAPQPPSPAPVLPTATPRPAPSNPPIPVTVPTQLPVATLPPLPSSSCLYLECTTEVDCCVEAPVCRSRNLGGGGTQVLRLCSPVPREPKTRLSDGLGGAGGRPPRGEGRDEEVAPTAEEEGEGGGGGGGNESRRSGRSVRG